MDEQEPNTELIIFIEGHGEKRYPIRRVWHNGRFSFSVVDIIEALEVSQHART